MNKVFLKGCECALDLGDGSERGFYVNQDYILGKLGKVHRGISLMYTYYPNDKEWPTRASKIDTGREATGAWDYPYEDYFPYRGGREGLHDEEPFNFMNEIRQHGQDVVLTITIDPTLTREDIIPIAKLYLDQFRKESGFKFEDFSNEAKTKIEDNFWIGNADELINCVQRGFIVGQPPLIKAMDLGFERGAPLSDISTIETVQENKTLKFAIDSFKREYIKKILEENDWNQTKTAKILGIQRTYVIKLIEDLNIKN